jgi:predicted nucleic acid-binding protein
LIWDTADVLASAPLIVVEARAALAAAKRGARLTAAQHREAKGELAALVDALTIVEVTELLIAEAADLAEQEALRGYGAVHLAAALTVEADVVTTADMALCDAAARRGLHVANPLDA